VMLNDLNDAHLRAHANEVELRSRMATFDTAQGLMREAPEAFDIAGESKATLDLYGAKNPASFGAQCLIARRMVERGVRVVNLFDVGSNTNWDNHDNMELHNGLAKNVDQPI